jgi:hypothetical protein
MTSLRPSPTSRDCTSAEQQHARSIWGRSFRVARHCPDSERRIERPLLAAALVVP